MKIHFALLLLAAVMLVLLPADEAATCNPTELSSCLPAFTSGSAPSRECCSKLREQKPCLCGYIRNPSLRQYINNPNARRVASTCGVPFPKC